MATKEKVKFSPDTVKARPLTNGEIRALRKAGLHIHYLNLKDEPEKLEEFTDYILDNIYPNVDFDNATQKECIKLAADTLVQTYGDEEEVKNSQRFGRGLVREGLSIAVYVARPTPPLIVWNVKTVAQTSLTIIMKLGYCLQILGLNGVLQV